MGEARKRSFEDGGTSGKRNVSSTQLTSLCRAIEATHNFEKPTNLAVFPRQDVQRKFSNEIDDGQLSSCVRKKMVDYIRAYKR